MNLNEKFQQLKKEILKEISSKDGKNVWIPNDRGHFITSIKGGFYIEYNSPEGITYDTRWKLSTLPIEKLLDILDYLNEHRTKETSLRTNTQTD